MITIAFGCAQAAAIASLLSCGEGQVDPYDPDTIREDISQRTPEELFDEADKIPYAPPESGELTREQVEMYLRVKLLSKKIQSIALTEAERRGRAMESGDKLSQMSNAFKGIGSLRAAVAADVRAALLLKVNAQEFVWVRDRIYMAASLAPEARRYREAWDEAKAGAAAAGSSVTSYQTQVVNQRKSLLRKWEKEHAAAVANMKLLRDFEDRLNGSFGEAEEPRRYRF